MAVSLAKGALRFVGGQLSHQGEASVSAGGATIGIRGGTTIITHNEAILVNGLLSMGNGCPAVKRPGFKIMLPCGPISQVTEAEFAYFIRLFGGNLGGNGGVAGLTGANLGNPSYPPNPIFSPPGLPPIFGTDPNNVVHQGTTQGTLPLLPPPPPPLPPPLPPPCSDCIRTLPRTR